jgi:hypothetical protein
MADVESGSSKNEERGFIVECIKVYNSLPALWVVKSKEYSNCQKEKMHMKFRLTNTETDTQKQTERTKPKNLILSA